MRPLITRAVFLVLFCYTGLTVHAQHTEEPLAVIVHPDNPVSDMSFREVRRLLRMDRQYWSPGRPVSLILPGPAVPERRRALARAYQMSEQAFRQYWISVAYGVQALNLPRPYGDCEVAVRIVGSLEDAMSVVRASCIDESVKVIYVDQRKPGDEGYRL